MEYYVAFLRGINVGGHHKVPMVELRKVLEKLNLKNSITILNSGNVIFDAKETLTETLEKKISTQLESTFGFPVPTIIRTIDSIQQLVKEAPFQEEPLTKDIRWYISFLKKVPKDDFNTPWISSDGSCKIIEQKDNAVLTVLDLSISKTPIAMKAVEEFFGKDITTRNWKTIERIVNKLETSLSNS